MATAVAPKAAPSRVTAENAGGHGGGNRPGAHCPLGPATTGSLTRHGHGAAHPNDQRRKKDTG
ncbi:hypothetical protein DTL70_19220 [Streptomyces diacarni]|uniref:Uncharacterized protein n=1 Tax=Streptomyces diacarni TaxID=2800381 RepID=A0A367EWK8_9ACTN|nr:hypothetical protein DTL70_19220 [Streptomyces diacarni]